MAPHARSSESAGEGDSKEWGTISMPQLLYILRAFRTGKINQQQLIAKIQLLLTDARISVDDLIDALEAEQSANALPSEVFDAVVRHLRLSKDHTLVRPSKAARASIAAAGRDGEEFKTILLDVEAAPEAERPVTQIANGTMLLGRFGLVEQLGEGGMSRVYKAVDLRKVEAGADDPHVAVKVLTVPFADYTDAMAVLHRETNNLQGLTHPNIVRVIDCDRDGDTVFMTMEYLPGRTLNAIIRAARSEGIARNDALPIIQDIADALEFAHSKNIVHGDLKPGNIIVTESGRAKVIDFGIARMIAQPISALVRQKSPRRDQVSGLTPAYASPEMLEDQGPDPRDDVYALGCMAWEIMTGAHPFARKTAIEARDAGMKPDRPQQLSTREYRALLRALEFDRARRTPSARQFIVEFTGASARMRWRMAASAGLACVVAAAAFVYLPRKAAAPVQTATAPAATQPAAPTLSVGTVFRDCPTCPLMIVLPPGQFVQGSAAGARDTEAFETPQRSVTIPHAFAASQHEVTVGEFAEFVKAAPRQLSGCTTYDGAWNLNAQVSWKNAVEGQTALHPVSCVSWEDAKAYAEWLSQRTQQKYRLPSASEWEYAARAGSPAARPWTESSAACAEANVADETALQRYPGWTTHSCVDTYVQTAPVGSFAANAFGLHDMLGNVFEWVEDCWSDDYRAAPTDGSVRAGNECTQRETRGGSWFTTPAYVRVAYRNRFEPSYRATSVGFRVVRETGT